MNGHGGLTVLEGGKFLRPGHRYGGVARNNLLHQATHGFQPQRQRNHVQQQHVAVRLVADQHIGLNGGTDGHDFVGIQAGQRFTRKKLANPASHQRHPGRATDHHHFPHFIGGHTGIFQRPAARHQGLVDPGQDQGIELGPGQGTLPAGPAHRHAVAVGQCLLGGTGGVQQIALLSRGHVGDPGLLLNPVGQRVIEVIAAQGRIATGGQHLEYALVQTQNGDIEGTAAQIIHRNHPFLTGVQAIGDGGGGGFVEQAQYLETGQSGRVLGALALGIIEIGRHCDHGTLNRVAQTVLGSLCQILQDLGRHLHRVDRSQRGVQLDDTGAGFPERIRQSMTGNIRQCLAHQAFHRGDGVLRIKLGFVLGVMANPQAVRSVMHHRRQQIAPLLIGQGFGQAAANHGDQGVGGTEIDTDRPLVFMRSRALARLGNL